MLLFKDKIFMILFFSQNPYNWIIKLFFKKRKYRCQIVSRFNPKNIAQLCKFSKKMLIVLSNKNLQVPIHRSATARPALVNRTVICGGCPSLAVRVHDLRGLPSDRPTKLWPLCCVHGQTGQPGGLVLAV